MFQYLEHLTHSIPDDFSYWKIFLLLVQAVEWGIILLVRHLEQAFRQFEGLKLRKWACFRLLQEIMWAGNTSKSQIKQTIQQLPHNFSTGIQTIVMLETLQVCPKYVSRGVLSTEFNCLREALVNVWGKRFKLPQLTHESFLTIDRWCKIFFWYLPNWTSTNLWCVVLYATYSTYYTPEVGGSSVWQISKKYFAWVM